MADWTWGPASLILVMYAFGGWSDAGFVAAEVRDPSRNIPRALLLGVGVVTVLYLLVNLAYLMGVGFDVAAQTSKAPTGPWPQLPLVVLENALGSPAALTMNLLVMISALGSANGLIFAGSRVYATLGNDHRLFAWLGFWKPGHGAPLLALLVQGLLTAGLVALFGTTAGHAFVDQTASLVGVKFDPKPSDAFDQLFAVSAPIFWALFLMTGVSLFVLRRKKPASERPFSVPLYPVLPLLFCATCCYGLWSAFTYMHNDKKLTPAFLLLLGIVLLGLPLYGLSRLLGYRDNAVDE
jgi:amino acid transporter